VKTTTNLSIKLIFIFLLFVAGCSGLGFEKGATLMPDSIGISLMQERYRGDDHAWRGASINATWEFK